MEQLDRINGLSIEQIEHRALPISDNTTDVEWKYRSFDGFLGEGETFKKVLMKDREQLEKLGTTCSALASYLREMIQAVEKEREEQQLGPMRPIRLMYSPKEHPIPSVEPQPLLITHNIYNGYQFSLFYNPNDEKSAENTSWNEEYCIRNTSLDLEVKVAGNATVGIVDYIERYGFFEGGGVANEYRVEPAVLWAIVSGKCTEEVCSLINAKWQLKMDKMKEQLRDLEVQLERVQSQDDDDDGQREAVRFFEGEKHIVLQRLHQMNVDRDKEVQSLKSKTEN